jgi:hypothetical protein
MIYISYYFFEINFIARSSRLARMFNEGEQVENIFLFRDKILGEAKRFGDTRCCLLSNGRM